MNWAILFIIFTIILIILLLMGQWIAYGLGTVGIIGLFFSGSDKAFLALGQITWNSINSFELTAVPLFIFMGDYIMRSGISTVFYRGIAVLVNKLPGGLLQSNIIACTFFSAISGSSVATAAAMGTVAIPELNEQGYNKKMTLGALAAGGTLGILIPPSIPMIIYGSLVEASVSKLFMAGILPGAMLAIMFMIYIGIRTKLNKNLTPIIDRAFTMKQKVMAFIDIAPVLILVIVILGSIYMGLATPTESAALGSILAVIASLLLKKFRLIYIRDSLREAARTSCMVLFIIIGAQIMSYMLVITGVSRDLSEWVVSLNLSKVYFLALIVIMYFILGCLMDGMAMLFLTLPVLYPIVEGMGLDQIWFGIVLVILIELAQITPPMGLNLFVLQGISKGPIEEIIWGSVPYFFILLIGIVILTLFPEIALWLPGQMVHR